MCKIKSNNSSNHIVFLSVLVICFVIVFQLTFDGRIEFLKIISLPLLFLLVLVCIYMFFKQVEITIEKNLMSVKWKLFGLSYRSIKVNFDKTEIIGNIHVYFYAYSKEVASFRYDSQDLESGEEYIHTIEMEYNGKTYSIGNKQNADYLFKKIIGCCRTVGRSD